MRWQLIVLVGLPRSGKTTWAKREEHPIVNPDSIRLALHGKRFEALAEPFVWAIAQVMVRALFLSGAETVIIDATNTTKKRRAMWISDEWDTVFQHVSTSKEECIRRAREESDLEIIPIIERMAAQFEPIERDEDGRENDQISS